MGPDAFARILCEFERASGLDCDALLLDARAAAVRPTNAQREGIKTYVSNLIIKISTDEGSFRRERTFLGKLNLVLVDILKQDWPHRWPSFIPDIVGASKTNETPCENSMHILGLLSEEVFDFSKNSLTVRVREVVGGTRAGPVSSLPCLPAPDPCAYSNSPDA